MEVNRLCAENRSPWNLYDSFLRKFSMISNILKKPPPLSQSLCAVNLNHSNLLIKLDTEVKPPSSYGLKSTLMNEFPKRRWPRLLYPNVKTITGFKTSPVHGEWRITDCVGCDVHKYIPNPANPMMESLIESSSEKVHNLNSNQATFVQRFLNFSKQTFSHLMHALSALDDTRSAECLGNLSMCNMLKQFKNFPSGISEGVDMTDRRDKTVCEFFCDKSQNSQSSFGSDKCDIAKPNGTLHFPHEPVDPLVTEDKHHKMNGYKLNKSDHIINYSCQEYIMDPYNSSSQKSIKKDHSDAVVPDVETYCIVENGIANKSSHVKLFPSPNDSVLETCIKEVPSRSFDDNLFDMLVMFDSDAEVSIELECGKKNVTSPNKSDLKRPVCENATVAFIIGVASDSEDDETDDDSDFGEWDNADNEIWESFQAPLASSFVNPFQPVQCDTSSVLENSYNDEVDSSTHSVRDLNEINRKWEVDVMKDVGTKSSRKKVCFANGKALAKTHHMYTWSYAYQTARAGPWEMYARDRARFQKHIEEIGDLIGHVFSESHRARVYDKLKLCSTREDNGVS